MMATIGSRSCDLGNFEKPDSLSEHRSPDKGVLRLGNPDPMDGYRSSIIDVTSLGNPGLWDRCRSSDTDTDAARSVYPNEDIHWPIKRFDLNGENLIHCMLNMPYKEFIEEIR
jgi:hypothetical protein